MSFFDSKEEVFDVQLTQFGKKLLAMGVFRPTFYAFFDDDILYNAQKAGFSEKQNQTESRIIKDTPKLKTQHLTTGVVTSFADLEIFDTPGDVARLIIPGRDEPDEDDMPQLRDYASSLPESHLLGLSFSKSGFRIERFRLMTEAKRNFDYNVQEKILLYPLCNQEVSNPQAPSFDVVSLDTKFKNFGGYQHFTGSGIIKNIPQFEVVSTTKLIKNVENIMPIRPASSEDFYDRASEEIVFRNNSKLQLEQKSLTFDVEELNVDFEKENFVLEIFEISETTSVDREGNTVNNPPRLRKIENIEEIRRLFSIKVDNSAPEEFNYRTQKERNHQDRSRQ